MGEGSLSGTRRSGDPPAGHQREQVPFGQMGRRGEAEAPVLEPKQTQEVQVLQKAEQTTTTTTATTAPLPVDGSSTFYLSTILSGEVSSLSLSERGSQTFLC